MTAASYNTLEIGVAPFLVLRALSVVRPSSMVLGLSLLKC